MLDLGFKIECFAHPSAGSFLTILFSFYIRGFPKLGVPFWDPMILFEGPYCGPVLKGNYHL